MATPNPTTKKKKPLLVHAIKEMGYKISGLITLLEISRATFYNKATHPSLPFLQAIRAVTSPKLDEYFPVLKANPYPGYTQKKEGKVDLSQIHKKLLTTDQKYRQLSEDYNALLATYRPLAQLVLKVAEANGLEELKNEVMLLKNEE